MGRICPFDRGGGDRALAGGAVLTEPEKGFRPKDVFAAFLSEEALSFGHARAPSKLGAMCRPAVFRAVGMSVLQFVTAPKMPLRSIRTDTEVCNFKPLKLLDRATPPGPTTHSRSNGDFPEPGD